MIRPSHSRSPSVALPEPLNPSRPDLGFDETLTSLGDAAVSLHARMFFGRVGLDHHLAQSNQYDEGRATRLQMADSLQRMSFDYIRGASGKDGEEPPPTAREMREAIGALQMRFGLDKGTLLAETAINSGGHLIDLALDLKTLEASEPQRANQSYSVKRHTGNVVVMPIRQVLTIA